MAKKYTDIGSLNQAEPQEGQTKGDLYVKVFIKNNGNVTLKTGDRIKVEDPKVKFDRMLKSGKLTQEQYDNEVNRIPSYVKKNLTVVQEE